MELLRVRLLAKNCTDTGHALERNCLAKLVHGSGLAWATHAAGDCLESNCWQFGSSARRASGAIVMEIERADTNVRRTDISPRGEH
jgi:hypothetical protein